MSSDHMTLYGACVCLVECTVTLFVQCSVHFTVLLVNRCTYMPSASAAPQLSVANSSCVHSLCTYLLVDVLSSELGPSYVVVIIAVNSFFVFCDVPIDSTLSGTSNQFGFSVYLCPC